MMSRSLKHSAAPHIGRLLLFGVLAVVLVANSACQERPKTAQTSVKPAITEALFNTGKRLYEKQCAVCHGLGGTGDGAAAYLLYPKPRDFTQNEFRLVSTNNMQATDEDLFLTITRGMPGSAMPAWETLSAEQRWALVYYVRSLAEEPKARADGYLPQELESGKIPWSTRESLITERIEPEAVIQVPQETPKTTESIERGREIFAQACASCHGPQGRGDGPQVLSDNAGFPIKARDITAGIFKGSSESRDLYYRIVAGLPGSPMPSYAGVYSDEQLGDLIHYVQSLVPPGVEDRVRMHARTIRAHRIRGSIPLEPSAEVWSTVEPVYVALTPLWWRDNRIEGFEVKALHNGKELALHLSWNDPTRDSSTLTPQAFSDGAAVEFSSEQDPPFFGMGDAAGAVHIWYWKASWQEDLKGWQDMETAYPNAVVDRYPAQRDYQPGEFFEVSQSKTSLQDQGFMGGWGAGNTLSDPNRTSAAEEATAKGLGTLTSREPAMQRIQAEGDWQQGRWQVVLRRPLSSNEEGALRLKPGQQVRAAFAVWDGHARDRNGQKSVSIWHTLEMER